MRLTLLLTLLMPVVFGADTRNVILVTADGMRWQELFHGIDPMLAHEKSAGMERADDRRKKYERSTDRERREALMPFFWTKLAPRAAVFSDVKVTNRFRVSYPGYSEILTGHSSDDVIQGNQAIRNPNETVLEFPEARTQARSGASRAVCELGDFPADRRAHRRLHYTQRRIPGD